MRHLVAGSVGSVAPARVPWTIAVVAPVSIAVAVTLAAGPAWAAARVQAAQALRAE